MENELLLSKLNAAYNRAQEAKTPSIFFTALVEYIRAVISHADLVNFISGKLELESTNRGAYFWERLHEFWWYYRLHEVERIPLEEDRQYRNSKIKSDWRRKDQEIAAVFANEDSNNIYFRTSEYREILIGAHRLLFQWLKSKGQFFEPKLINIELDMPRDQIIAKFPDGDLRLLKTLRTDLQNYIFMKHLFLNPEAVIGRGTIQIIKGMNTINDLSDKVRRCGFDRQLKTYFFKQCTAKSIQFRPKISVTDEDARNIMRLIPQRLK